MNHEPRFTSGDVLLLAGVRPDTLRDWRRLGVPLPDGRGQGEERKHRRYTLRDVAWVAVMKACARAGISLMAASRFGEHYCDPVVGAVWSSGAWTREEFVQNSPMLIVSHDDMAGEEVAAVGFVKTLGTDLVFLQLTEAVVVNLGAIGLSLRNRLEAVAHRPGARGLLPLLNLNGDDPPNDGDRDDPAPDPIQPLPADDLVRA